MEISSPWISYLLFSALGLATFYVADKLLVGRMFLPFAHKRGYYLFALSFSILIPWVAYAIPFRVLSLLRSAAPQTSQFSVEQMIVSSIGLEKLEPIPLSLEQTLLLIWIIGMAVVLLRSICGVGYLLKIILTSKKKTTAEGSIFFVSEKAKAPFILFRSIVIPSRLYHSPAFPIILKHEEAHRQGQHFWDRTLAQCCLIVQWWNPFVYGLIRAQRQTLEYMADESAIGSGVDKKEYQMQLLRISLETTAESVSLSFAANNLKKRIVMLNSNRTEHKKSSLWCLSFSTFAIALLLFMGSNITAQPAKSSLQKANSPQAQLLRKADEAWGQIPDTTIYHECAIPPQYIGEGKSIAEFVSKHFPHKKELEGVSGTVVVRFIVEKDGSIQEAKIIQSPHQIASEEAIGIVRLLRFTPGRDKENKSVRVSMVLPIRIGKKVEKTLAKNQKKEFAQMQPAQYQGGDISGLIQEVMNEISFPKGVKEVQGRVVVRFVVDATGKAKDLQLVKKLYPEFDNEVLRAVNKVLQKTTFTPAKENGKPVASTYTLPVLFSAK